MKSKIVTAEGQANENITSYEDALESSDGLVELAPYARSWYAYQDEHGKWHFGPSKFIGYVGMTAKEYLNGKPRDGRLTERKLQDWFTVVHPGRPLYNELEEALKKLLASFGKVPSAKFRINVSNKYLDQDAEAEVDADEDDDALTDLIIAVAKRLKRAERNRIVAAL